MASDQAPALRPFISAPGLPPTGAQMGIDVLSGGSFYADPLGWVLASQASVTNANVMCFGKPGGGKSATSKAFLLRMTDFGYRVLILGDPKDEYEPMCHALGWNRSSSATGCRRGSTRSTSARSAGAGPSCRQTRRNGAPPWCSGAG